MLTATASFKDLFETPAIQGAAPQAVGLDGFFKGAFSYHFHNFWYGSACSVLFPHLTTSPGGNHSIWVPNLSPESVLLVPLLLEVHRLLMLP
jgi:hypothetical protein